MGSAHIHLNGILHPRLLIFRKAEVSLRGKFIRLGFVADAMECNPVGSPFILYLACSPLITSRNVWATERDPAGTILYAEKFRDKIKKEQRRERVWPGFIKG
jgi:hypothetical protein